MRSLKPERHTAAIFALISFGSTKRKVSNCPANECREPSSSRADERTAKRTPSTDNACSASFTSRWISSDGFSKSRAELNRPGCSDVALSTWSLVRPTVLKLAVNADGDIANHEGTRRPVCSNRTNASPLPPSPSNPPPQTTHLILHPP